MGAFCTAPHTGLSWQGRVLANTSFIHLATVTGVATPSTQHLLTLGPGSTLHAMTVPNVDPLLEAHVPARFGTRGQETKRCKGGNNNAS